MPPPPAKWYSIVQSSEELLQGDILTRYACPFVLDPPVREIREETEVEVEYQQYDVAVLTQSCDLAQGKSDYVAVAIVYPFDKLPPKSGYKEQIRLLRVTALYLLEPVDEAGVKMPLSVVDFRKTFLIPIQRARDTALAMDRRVRMVPPFRERLSQHFGLYFSRVGLP